jgi:acyl-CoA synthetase (AMP-forming)/AMP-acid ligase II
MNLASILEMAAASVPDRVAIAPDVTYLGLLDRVQAGAAALAASNARQVAYIGANGLALPTALFAAAWTGVPFLPLNFRLAPEQLESILQLHDGTWLITDGDLEFPLPPSVIQRCTAREWVEITGQAAEAPPLEDLDDSPAVYLYTSGTTGAPKAVVLRHRHLVSYVLSNVDFLNADENEAALVAVPPYHIAGIANLLTNVFAGRTLVYLDRFSEAAWLNAVLEGQVTHAMMVPTMLARVATELEQRGEFAPRSLRSISYGGAKTPVAVLQRALDRFPDVSFVNAYGLTETSSTIALLGPDDHRAAQSGDPAAITRLKSVGKVLPSVRVRVLADDGSSLPSGSIGQIAVSGDQVSGEYLGSGSAFDADGWYHTSDVGWLDDEGYLFVEGRADDMIIRGGENVAPAEIEDVLRTHPSIEDVAVVGVPDDEWGERIVAVVVGDEIDLEELRTWSHTRLRTSKSPAEFWVKDALPYSDTGKLLRRQVREMVGLKTND